MIILDAEAIDLPQISVAVQVSVTVPPHAPGVAVKVLKFEVPLTKQPPLKLLLKAIVLAGGRPPQATVIGARAVIVGKVAGLTVIILETLGIVLPQTSIVVHVSVTVPPQAHGVVVNVLAFDVPLIRQPPLNPLVKVIVLGAGTPPQATVIGPGAVIVGNAAGLTVINLNTEAIVLPQLSVAVHVSVTVPPQAPGVVLKMLGFEVPLIKQPPLSPLLKLIVLAAGTLPQATVIGISAVIVGRAAGLTAIVWLTVVVFPLSSVTV